MHLDVTKLAIRFPVSSWQESHRHLVLTKIFLLIYNTQDNNVYLIFTLTKANLTTEVVFLLDFWNFVTGF